MVRGPHTRGPRFVQSPTLPKSASAGKGPIVPNSPEVEARESGLPSSCWASADASPLGLHQPLRPNSERKLGSFLICGDENDIYRFTCY